MYMLPVAPLSVCLELALSIVAQQPGQPMGAVPLADAGVYRQGFAHTNDFDNLLGEI